MAFSTHKYQNLLNTLDIRPHFASFRQRAIPQDHIAPKIRQEKGRMLDD